MPEPTPSPNNLRPDDPTLDSSPESRPDLLSSGLSSSKAESGIPGVALVEGATPKLTGEIQDLLQQRLRVAAAVLFVGFAATLVRHYFRVTTFSNPVEAFLFGFHVVATAVLGLLAVDLCRRCIRPRGWLSAAEWLTFGLPTVFAGVMQFFITLASCREGVLDFPEGFWLVLIYTYALFIPNTMRRAAVAIGLMASMPVLLLLAMMWWFPIVHEHVTWEQLWSLTLLFILAGGGSVIGVGMIGSLRREAFEARRLGQYVLTRCIGVGGMGEVHLAEHRLLKRPCVVKLIRPDKAGNPKNLARFQREVRATAKLSHWNTIEIFDYGCTTDGTFYYVMEYLPGMSVGDVVERFGPMPPERVIYLLRQVCDALAEAHAVGLVHRDIKPGNIFAARLGGVRDVAKLLDFGLVKPIMEEEPIHLTAEGAITGSPLFMSPEQALGDGKPDQRSDIYSLGAVAYYLLTGRPPFEADKAIKVIFAHAYEPVTPPSRHRSDVPADVERVILQCLEKKADDRFQSAAALELALAECESASRWSRAAAAQWWDGKER